MNKRGYCSVALLASAWLWAQSSDAAPVYDARTLGMGNNSVGLAENASLAFWNPAAVGMSRSFGVFLPSLGFYAGNNILAPTQILELGSLLPSPDNPANATQGAALLRNLGDRGLTVGLETIVEPLGLSLGSVGPGAMAVRVYARGALSGTVNLSGDFAENLNDLFYGGGLNEISSAVTNLSGTVSNLNPTNAAGLAKARGEVTNLQGLLSRSMSSFIKTNGAKATVKKLDVRAVSTAHAAVAATYGQSVPLQIKALPDASLNLGVTTKLFMSPGAQLAAVRPITLPGPGGREVQVSALGGGFTTSLSLNIDREVTDLVEAIGDFEKEQNLATVAQLASKTGNFVNTGLGSTKLEMTSLIPNDTGVGFDLGAVFRVNRDVSVGMTLVNPLLFWGATKTTYTYSVTSSGINLASTKPTQSSFAEVEPTVWRGGFAWTPGDMGLIVQGSLEKAFNAFPLSANLGLEKQVGPLAFRLGTQQGAQPLYTTGLGLQTRGFQLNLGVGMDNLPAQAKAVAGALTLGAGF